MTDEITLTLPPDRAFYRVAHLVLGGLAVRLDLTYDTLEDIQLALDELLARADDKAVTLTVRVEDDELRTSVGPFGSERLRHELERETADNTMTLRRLLETVSDRVEIGRGDGGDFVELTKTVRSEAA